MESTRLTLEGLKAHAAMLQSQQAEKERSEAEYSKRYAEMGCLEQPKPWVELSIEEKIERMREQVKVWAHGQRCLDQRINDLLRLRDDLLEHRHAIEDGGKVMLPMERRKSLGGHGDCCTAAQDVDPSKVYF